MNYNLIISTICKFQVPKTKFMKILNTLYGIMICARVPLRFMQQIGDRMATRTGDKKSTYYLLQQISMLERGY